MAECAPDEGDIKVRFLVGAPIIILTYIMINTIVD